MQDFIKIHPGDMVAVALKPLAAGTHLTVAGDAIELKEAIPQGHKVALCQIPAGAQVV